MSVLMGGHAATNEREANGYRWLWRGMVGAALAVTPLQGARAITTQEQPYHPAPFARAGLPATNLAGETAFVKSTHDATLEQDRRGRAFFFPGSPFKAPALQSTSVIVRQEQPRDASVVSRPSIQGPNVGTGVPATAVMVAPQVPVQPPPLLRASIQGPNVGSGIAPPLITLPQTPVQPPSIFGAGIQGPNVASGITTSIVVKQEAPFHPASYFWPTQAYLASTALSAETCRLIVPPEAPPYQAGTLRSGIQGPNVASGITSIAVVRQEQPAHPSPFTWPTQKYSTAVLSSPMTRPVVTIQEQPFHPSSFVSAGGLPATNLAGETSFIKSTHDSALERDKRGQASFFFGTFSAPSATMSPERRQLITTQEQPAHPAPFLSVGTANFTQYGPGVLCLIYDGSLQEQPPQPLSIVKSAQIFQAPVALPAVQRAVITTQEVPFHPAPYVWRAQIYVPSVSLTPEKRGLVTSQEQPSHPPSVLRPGIQGPNVALEVVDWVITTREQPGHPSSFLLSGSGYAVSSTTLLPGARNIVTAQEQPPYQSATLRSSIQAQNVASGITNGVVTRQEQPFHPASYVWKAQIYVPSVFIPAGTRSVVTTQEAPFHPGSTLNPGVRPINVAPLIPVVQGGGGSWPLFADNFEEAAKAPPRRKRRRAVAPPPPAPPEIQQEVATQPAPTGPAPPPGLMGTALGTPVQPPSPAPVKVRPRVNHEDDDRDFEEISRRDLEGRRAEIEAVIARIEHLLKQ